MSHFVTLTWLFFVSVKGAKGPIGPIGDLGTKGVEVMSPCCVVKMCVKFLYVERQIYDRKVYSLCGAKLSYFVTQGDPGGRGATGDLGTGGEMVSRCYCQKKINNLRAHLTYFIKLLLPIWIFLKGERGSPGDKGATGSKGKRVSLFAVGIITYLYIAVRILRVER